MTMRQIVGVTAAAIIVSQGTTVYAQHGGTTLPNGRPFQILEAQIGNIDAAVQAQIAELQAQLDANAANDAAQSQLVGALQVLVGTFEMRLAGVQWSVEQLNQYNALHEMLFQQQIARINNLQSEVANQAAAIQGFSSQLTALFNLHNMQQSAIAAIQNQISMLSTQLGASHEQVLNLMAQLATLNQQYQTTRSWLASGCPAGTSIRQVGANGGVNCEQDSSTVLSMQFAATVVTILPGGSAVSQVFCPPNNQVENWVATGGGFAMGPGVVLSSQKAGNGWQAAFFNPSSSPISANATVTCALSRN